MTDYLSVTLRVVDAMSAPLRSITDRMQAMTRACTTIHTESERLAAPFYDAGIAASSFVSVADGIQGVRIDVESSGISEATEKTRELSENLRKTPTVHVDAETPGISDAMEKTNELSENLRKTPTVHVDAETSGITEASKKISIFTKIINRRHQIRVGADTSQIRKANGHVSRLSAAIQKLTRIAGSAKNFIGGIAGSISSVISKVNQKLSGVNNILMTIAYTTQTIFFASRLIQSAWSKIANTISRALSYSDTVTQTIARINIAGDTQYSADDIMSAAYNAATRSRSDYLATADAVSKLMVRAPDAFSNAGEVVQFTENLNKLFRIAGATTEEQNSATLQLTQALGSGVLRGEEFNAVFEAAPNIMRTIADSMGVPIGSLREMAANGEITADIVKKALLGATDSIDAEFRKIPRTWESVLTSLSTTYERAFQKMQASINRMLNVPSFDQIIDAISNGIVVVSDYAARMVNKIADGLNRITSYEQFNLFVSDLSRALSMIMKSISTVVGVAVWGAEFTIRHWKVARIPLVAVMAAVSSLITVFTILKATMLASAAATTIKTIALAALTGATGSATAATSGLTVAQLALNVAAYAFPLTWIVIGLAAVVASIYLAVGAFNRLTGSTVSATGIIIGAMAALGAYVYNQVAVLYNYTAGFVELLYNLNHPIYAIMRMFADLATFAVSQFGFIAEAIDKITGSDITSQMKGLTDRMNAYLIATMPEDYKTVNRIEYANVADEFSNGYNFRFADSLSGLNLSGLTGVDLETGSIEGILSKIEANTASAASSLEMSKDEIGYMRMIADNRTISNNSISSVKIDMTNNNSISNGYDSDVFVSNLVESLDKSYRSSARRIHS